VNQKSVVYTMHDLTAFQRDLLYAVAGNDGEKGLALKRALEGYGYPSINHGRLYPNLDELAEKGLISKGSIDDRTNSYSLTQRGETEIEARLVWEDEQLEAVFA